MTSVLIVCTGNTCRSPMAEQILKYVLKNCGKENLFNVTSRGIAAYDGDIASENAVKVCNKLGLDLTGHKAQRLNAEDVINADKIYVMSEAHKEYIVSQIPQSKDKIKVLNILDPYGQSEQVYEACTNQFIRFFEEEYKND